MVSICIPTMFPAFIIFWVTLLGKTCTRTYLLSGRYVTQILSVLLSGLHIKAPSPPFSKIFLAPAAVSASIMPDASSISSKSSSYSLPFELAIILPSGMHKYTSAVSPK